MRWPFIVEGLLVGLLGALITLVLLLARVRAHRATSRDAIAGQVPVGFSQSLTTQVAVLVLGVRAWASAAWAPGSPCAPTCVAEVGPGAPLPEETGAGPAPSGPAIAPSGSSPLEPVPPLAPEPPVSPGPPAAPQGWSLGTRIAAVTVLLLSAVALFTAGLTSARAARAAIPTSARPCGPSSRPTGACPASTWERSTARELVEGAIRGMFEALDDPYSAYMGPDEYSSTLAVISGEFEGIGARMTSEDVAGVACDPLGDGCRLVVVEVLPDTPAERAGLLDGDVVRSVDEQPLAGRTFEAAVSLIRGPRGTRGDAGRGTWRSAGVDHRRA